MKRFFTILIAVISFQGVTHAQVLISLLLGDKLNSDGLEFGLDGGFNWSTLDGTEGNFDRRFNLGFYFDVKFPDRSWMLHTGVIVKSRMGAGKLDVYDIPDPDVDSVFAGGSVERRLEYFNVPIMIKYMTRPRIYFEGGFMLGLNYKASDVFKQEIYNKDDAQFTNDVSGDFNWFDVGLIGGMGYKFRNSMGMYLGARFYYGLMDVSAGDRFPEQRNQAFFVSVGVPIGAGQAVENREGEEIGN